MSKVCPSDRTIGARKPAQECSGHTTLPQIINGLYAERDDHQDRSEGKTL